VVIAFGMGDYLQDYFHGILTLRLELVPSVIESFGDYHTDSKEGLNNPKGRIVIDDGRRFLNRTKEAFDLITVDPPPPIEAAGTALLYSEDFYEIVKKRLKPNGIFFHWFPGSLKNFQPVIRSVKNSFPYVKVFEYNPNFGFHVFCSLTPIKIPSQAEFSSRLPQKAKQDLMEKFPKTYKTLSGKKEQVLIDKHLDLIKAVLRNKLDIGKVINDKKQARINDDRPYNEYFFLRKTF
jgi:spermidine synthase